MKIKTFILLLVTINIHSLQAQLSDEYIKNYKENFGENIPNNFKINSNSKQYVYQYNEKTIIISEKGKEKKLNGSKILSIQNDKLYYLNNDSLTSYNLNNQNKIVPIGKVNNVLLRNTNSIYYLDNNLIYVFFENNVKVLENKETINLYNTRNRNYLTISKNNEHILVYKNEEYKFKDSIIGIIDGFEEDIILTNFNLNLIDSNNKKIIAFDSNIENIKYLLSNNCFYYNHEIFIITNEKKISKYGNNYYLSDSVLDFKYFDNIATNQKEYNINIYKTYNLKSKIFDTIYTFDQDQMYMNILKVTTTPPELNNFIIFTKYEILQNELKYINYLYNIIRKKEIRLNDLIENISECTLSSDGKYLFILSLNNELYRFDFDNEKLDKIMEHYEGPFENMITKNNLQGISISKYDSKNKLTYFNSNSKPFILDSIGKIKYFYDDDINYHFYDIIDQNNYILYHYNFIDGNSSIAIFKDGKIIKISKNENYKILQEDIIKIGYRHESKGYFDVFDNFLIWSESNIKSGTQIYKYEFKKNIKTILPIRHEKLYDTLENEYFSIKYKEQYYRGGLKFPKNYDLNKKYPTIISIYLNKMERFNFPTGEKSIYKDIENKSYSALLNELNLLHQGYIICYIDFPINDGIYSSHSQIVNETIKTILCKIKQVDIKNIGLLGHSLSVGKSFGVITSDTLVKCSILSNGILSELLDITNFANYSESYEQIRKVSRFNKRFNSSTNTEYDIFKEIKYNFKKTIKEDPYFKIEQLNTPILFMLNDLDASINSNSGYYAYIKTKLHSKNTYLLNFHDDSHWLTKEKNQRLAYNIFIDFLNFYLKQDNSREVKWYYK